MDNIVECGVNLYSDYFSLSSTLLQWTTALNVRSRILIRYKSNYGSIIHKWVNKKTTSVRINGAIKQLLPYESILVEENKICYLCFDFTNKQ